MRTPDQALAWYANQNRIGSTAWSNRCEKAARTAYGLPAHFASAELHAKAIPTVFRHGHEMPSKGDLMMIMNGGFGHIAVFTGNGWQAWSNDFGGRGKIVLVADARVLVPWCGGLRWYVADAWWSPTNYRRTHTVKPAPTPAPKPTVALANLRYGKTNGDVMDLQRALNRHNLSPDLPVTGFYGPLTDAAVRKDQQVHSYGNDPAGKSNVGPKQAAHLGLKVV